MSKEKEDLRKREERTLEVYERWADFYDRNRDRSLFEKEYIDLFLSHISNSLVTEDGLEPFILTRNNESCQGFSILMAKKRGSL